MNSEGEKKLALPGNSHEIVAKILHAYALCGDEPASLDAEGGHAQDSGVGEQRLPGKRWASHRWQSKGSDGTRKKLALAIGHGLDEDSALEWRRALLGAPAAKGIIDMIRVQKEIPSAALPGRIASTLGLPDTQVTRTGTKCLIDILKTSGILVEKDGKYSLIPERAVPEDVSPGSEAQGAPLTNLTKEVEVAPVQQSAITSAQPLAAIPIHVNIELHLPASSEQAVYDALFKSIRENLLKQ